MLLTKPAFVVAGIFIHSATATFGYGGWGGDSHYSTPDNTDNKCSSDQSKGYNWDGLASGSFDSYGSNKFSKWSCTNSFGKRDLLTKRTFQSKCISSNLDDEPSIGCDGDDSMSIDKYDVSSSEDADIECHYEMPDQTVCKEYHSCKSGGTVIQNTQCGGAKSVTFKPAESFQGKNCSIGVHSIGFNCGTASSTAPVASKTETIPGYSSSSPPVYTTTISESSTEAVSTSSEVQITTDTTPYTSPSSIESATSTASETPSSTETAPTYGTSSSTDIVSSTSSMASETAPVGTTSVSASDSESSTCLAGYGSSCSTTSTSTTSTETGRETSPVETTASEYAPSSTPSTTSSSGNSAVTDSTTSMAPFTLTGTPTYLSYGTAGSGTASTYNTSLTYKIPAYTQSSSTAVEATSVASYSTGTIYSTTCETLTSSGSITTLTKSYAVSTTIAPITLSGKESSPVETSFSSTIAYSGPEPSSPALLPRCLNTWMYLTDCSSNSDSNCYCKHSDYINKVYGCLSSWSQSADNATNGVSYLMGLCAPYISENPAIITACPSTITPAAYTPPATTSVTSTVTPTSTITLQSTITSSLTVPVPSGSTEVSPQTTGPATTAPASVPCTTITYSQVITVPATYPSGTSQGSTIPSSSLTSAIVTTITVPQVQITTYTVTESGTTMTAPGLGYGVPETLTSTTGRVTLTAAPPVVTSQTIPVYGSVGFTKSASASYSAPSGVVPYEGDAATAFEKGAVRALLMGVCMLTGAVVVGL